jgi:hypothetical protein
MAANDYFNVKVTRRSTIGSSLTLTLQLDAGSGVNTRWNFNREVSTVSNPSLT